ncbi:MAG: hypothetical protein QOJ52_1322, partial [Acidimicrobiaceae bacterium]|nr:hypothetical protein [Acidimicrobiaceae bacterium]
MSGVEKIERGKSSPDAAPTPAGVSSGEAVNPP